MPRYEVIFVDKEREPIKIEADDVELLFSDGNDEQPDAPAAFNFLKKRGDDDDDLTVGMIPFDNVLYIRS